MYAKTAVPSDSDRSWFAGAAGDISTTVQLSRLPGTLPVGCRREQPGRFAGFRVGRSCRLIWPAPVTWRKRFSRIGRACFIRLVSVDQIVAEGERDTRTDCGDDGSC
jgi:hypothetical protein